MRPCRATQVYWAPSEAHVIFGNGVVLKGKHVASLPLRVDRAPHGLTHAHGLCIWHARWVALRASLLHPLCIQRCRPLLFPFSLCIGTVVWSPPLALCTVNS